MLPRTGARSVATVSDQQGARCLTTGEVAARLAVSPRTVRSWRSEGMGPRFVRVGGRAIRYRPGAVDAYLAEREHDPAD